MPAAPELITYRRPACGHVETIEKQPVGRSGVLVRFLASL
jgi:hypothetical protein